MSQRPKARLPSLMVVASVIASVGYTTVKYGELHKSREEAAYRRSISAAIVEHEHDAPIVQTQSVTAVLRPQKVTVKPGYHLSIALKPGVKFAPDGLTDYGRGFYLPFADEERDVRFGLNLTSQPDALVVSKCSSALKRDQTSRETYLLKLRVEFKIPMYKMECDPTRKSYEMDYSRPLNDGSGLYLDCWGQAPYLGQRMAGELLAACRSVRIERLPKT